ncbi:MAG: GTPase Era [Vulcanimicrobiota bacterium]
MAEDYSTRKIEFHSGFIAVVGKPNVGKSTLVNTIVGQKISIISPKPQTTRHRILGVRTGVNYQLVFVDTPGIHQPEDELGNYMENTYKNEIRDSEIILYVADISHPPTVYDHRTRRLLSELKAENIPVFLAMNKIDIISRERIEKNKSKYMKLLDFNEVFEISALKGIGVADLENRLVSYLPLGPPYFPSDQLTDQSPELLASEIVREKILMKTRQEVPHGVFVHTAEVREGVNSDDLYFNIIIYVERDTHKGILIGKSGNRLKEIGSLARNELEFLLKKKVYLDLWVKVKTDWKERKGLLKSWGYES